MGTNEVLERTVVPRPLQWGLGVEAEGHRHVMAATYTCTPTWRAPLNTMGARNTPAPRSRYNESVSSMRVVANNIYLLH